jgi:hypothetical protein
MGEGRPLPWRTLALFFVPFAALAAATVLQRWFEGSMPTAGDVLLRWLLFSSAAGLLVGGVIGLIFGRNRRERYGWTLWGVVGPWCATVAVTGLLIAAGKLQERWTPQEPTPARHASETRDIAR